MTAPADDLREASPAASGSAIRIEGVTVTFPRPGGGEHTVLDDLHLEVPRGELVVLVGRSGCGKTTVLNMVAGLVAPDHGSVEVLGSSPAAARSSMGFMLARDALLPWRTARANVAYGLQLKGVAKAERNARAQTWLDAVHLDQAGDMWPWQLSQGMRQRVALARTWALDPALLLMDEPFAALDAQTRVSVQEEFLRLWQATRDRSVLFVTHDLTEALALGDRIVLISEGTVLEDVPVPFARPRVMAELVEQPDFLRLRDQLHEALR